MLICLSPGTLASILIFRVFVFSQSSCSHPFFQSLWVNLQPSIRYRAAFYYKEARADIHSVKTEITARRCQRFQLLYILGCQYRCCLATVCFFMVLSLFHRSTGNGLFCQQYYVYFTELFATIYMQAVGRLLCLFEENSCSSTFKRCLYVWKNFSYSTIFIWRIPY